MTTRRWLKIGSGIGIGIVTILGLFQLLISYYGFTVTDLTGDITCKGTLEEPCISEFTVRNPNPFNLDIYSKEQIRLNFTPEVEDYALFISDGRCSSTGSCRCELSNGKMFGMKGWRCIDFTNKTKPRADKVYNYRFEAYSTTKFRLVGFKDNPYEDIKWSFGVEKGNLDPVWIGIEREVIKTVTKTKYTYNSKIEEYSDNTGNAIIYSGMRYADSKGTLIENAKSLKNCEFCDEIKLSLRHTDTTTICNETGIDKKTGEPIFKCYNETVIHDGIDQEEPIEIIDYNLTSMIIKPIATADKLNKVIPIKVYDTNNISKVSYEDSKTIQIVNNEIVVPFGFDKTVKWGENSTTIQFYNLTGAGGIQSVWGTWDQAHDDTTGGSGVIQTSIQALSYRNDGFGGYSIMRGFIPFDVPYTNILSMSIHFYTTNYANGDNDGNDYVALVQNNTQASYTSLTATDFDNCGDVNNPLEVSNRLDLTSISNNLWYKWDVNISRLQRDENYISFGVREGHDIQDNAITSSGQQNSIVFSLIGSNAVYLNITLIPSYNLTITSHPMSVSAGDKKNLTFLFKENNANITSGINVLNVTIGTKNATILKSLISAYCNGIEHPCSYYSTQQPCQNASCSWSSLVIGTKGTKTCSQTWGFSCTSTTSGDNTYDTCTNHAGTDEHITEIYLNQTNATVNKWIQVKCEYTTTETTADELYLAYNSSLTGTWIKVKSASSSGSSGTKRNWTNTLKLNNTIGVHQIRCIIDYDGESDTCANVGSYYDNDDINITVYSSGGGECSGTAKTCAATTNQSACSAFGCTWNSAYWRQQLAWVIGQGWLVNVTMPSGLTGLQDLFIKANYSGFFRNDTEIDAIDYGGEEPPAPTGCNCTFPNNYAVDKTINMSCGCNVTSTSWCKNLITVDSGDLNVSSVLNVSNITSLKNNQIIYVSPTGRINIKG